MYKGILEESTKQNNWTCLSFEDVIFQQNFLVIVWKESAYLIINHERITVKLGRLCS